MAKKRIPNLLDDVVEKVIKPEPQGIRAYHGSPHDFDRFDLSKIGTGEGAQAYGHGLYFADNENIAKWYREQLTRGAGNWMVDGTPAGMLHGSTNPLDAMKFKVALEVRNGRPVDEAIDFVMKQEQSRLTSKRTLPEDMPVIQENLSLLNAMKSSPPEIKRGGRMYEVNIRANPDDFLDWDKPLIGTPANDKLKALDWQARGETTKGADIYNRMAEQWMNDRRMIGLNAEFQAEQETAKALREAGIPGIKYLDAGSRAAGDGSRNYVVFDDALIDIIRKYGIVPGGLLGAGAAMAPSNADAAPSRPDWIGADGAITGNPPWLRPDPNQRSTLGKLYDAVATDPLGTFKAAGGAIGDAVKGYFGEVRQDPGKGVADALELGVTAMGGAAPQAFWMATSPSEANAGEDAILAQRRKMMQGLLAD